MTKNGSKRKKEVISAEEALVQEEDAAAVKEENAAMDKFPETVSGSFGVSVDQHRRDTEVTELDGFVTAAMITGPAQDRGDTTGGREEGNIS